MYAAFQSVCSTWLRPCYRVSPNLVLPVEPCLDVFNWSNETCWPISVAAGFGDLFGDGNYIPPGNSLPMTPYWRDPDAGGALFFAPGGYAYALPNGTNITVPTCNAAGATSS